MLRKWFGIRFIFIVEGSAGKFDFATLTIALGAGLAYLGMAAVVADLVLKKFLQNSVTYARHKIKCIDEMKPKQADEKLHLSELSS